ncbi:hypothetical protein PR202_ga03988 [Eleusine coracana subsp. coracana]|uniref:Protein kinase domain-containing protein n=1 Tax=Eleusine coracana subsp. coracana TaxID=191504 RepID=A0AAV5BNH7_ELECO|nr:hypothetical protein PR202_ga03988 [Eleusine coracana subsp. coracana]
MPNGSLQDALLGRRRPELVAEWPRRLAVARDVAAALHYLHSVVTPAVVHGDVKPSNVLLDADLRARLADFGLAQFKPDPDADDGKPESGVIGYVAPEYGGGGPLSEKCDIYSYGVLLLVIISGRRPLQVTALPMSEFEKASLISWAKHLARASRLLDLVDPAMRDVNRDEALLCITVALLCIQRSPARRPSSEEVIAMLSCEGELPQLPLEFSPSPPGGFPFKSRKKVRSVGLDPCLDAKR